MGKDLHGQADRQAEAWTVDRKKDRQTRRTVKHADRQTDRWTGTEMEG